MTSAYNECPFRCGWTVTEARNEDDGAAALCFHLEVEHAAHAERDEEALSEALMSPEPPSPPFEFQDEGEGN